MQFLHRHTEFYFRALIILFTAGMMHACIDTDMVCPPEVKLQKSVTLTFHLEDEDDELLSEKIETVQLCVFDEQGRYYTNIILSKSQVSSSGGAGFDLPAGSYQMVCWGNVTNRSTIKNLQEGMSLQDAMIVHAASTQPSLREWPADGDALYYGTVSAGSTSLSFEECRGEASEAGACFTVPESGHISLPVSFTCAHRVIEVIVEGYTGIPGIELTNLGCGYDFTMTPLSGNPMCFRQQGTSTCFHVPLFTQNCAIQVRIYNPFTGATIYDFPLSEFLKANKVDPQSEKTVSIRVAFRDAGVEVGLGKWDVVPIDN